MHTEHQLAFRGLLPRLPSVAEQKRRWRELDARRWNGPALSLAELAEWDRLDRARIARLERIG